MGSSRELTSSLPLLDDSSRARKKSTEEKKGMRCQAGSGLCLYRFHSAYLAKLGNQFLLVYNLRKWSRSQTRLRRGRA